MNIKNFNPKKHHTTRAEYGLLGEAVNSPVECETIGNLKIARIPKKLLGIGKYQRPVDSNRVKKLKSSWHPEFGHANVSEINYRNKYYYQIVDGQHRACASPDEFLDCIVTNSNYPVDNFLMANSKEHIKPVSVDEIFWAKLDRVETIDSSDPDGVKFMYNLFKSYGFKPQPEYEKVNDFGRIVSKIHNFYDKHVKARIEKKVKSLGKSKSKRKGKGKQNFLSGEKTTDAEIDAFAKSVMTDIMDIMFGIFGKKTFTGVNKWSHAWQGMMRFLDTHNWDYDTDDIISTMKKGKWAKYGKGGGRDYRLKTIEDWNNAMYEYAILNQRTDQWRQLFKDVYTVSKKSLDS